MNTMICRHKWAILFAVLQLAAFVAVAMSEHQRKSPKEDGEMWGCWHLFAVPMPDRWPGWDENQFCRSPRSVRIVSLSNLPVILTSLVVADLARPHFGEVWIFCMFNGIGIPALWFGIGTVIDRMRRKKTA